MRILVISQITGTMLGGVPMETMQLARGLMARGHAVGLVTDMVLPGTEAASHFRISVPTDDRLPAEFGAAIEAFRPDFIHVMDLGPRGVLRCLDLLRAVPWTFTCHSVPPHERSVPCWHGSEALQSAARAAKCAVKTLAWHVMFARGVVPHTIVHSAVIGRHVRACGQPGRRVEVIPFGCEIEGEAFPLPPRPVPLAAPRIVTVGGIAHTKGHHDMLRALPEVLKRFPRATWHVVGEPRDGSYVDYLRGLAQRLGVAEALTISLSLPWAEKQRAVAEADLYVQPSHEEGFCLSYIEAALVAPRLLCTDTGAMKAVSEGDPAARVVHPHRPRALAKAAIDLLESPVPPDLHAHRRRHLATHFSWDQYLDRHEALYARLASEHLTR